MDRSKADRRKAARGTEGRMDGRTDSPCVLQDFVPFGAAALLPLNLNHFLLKQGKGTADHLLPLRCNSKCFEPKGWNLANFSQLTLEVGEHRVLS